jgi:hypothetical protein
MLAAPKTPGISRKKETHTTTHIFTAEPTFVEIWTASFKKLIGFSHINRLRSIENESR